MSEAQSTERPLVGAWFVSANPKDYLWDRAFAEGSVDWDGARNPLAQKNIRSCQPGDRVIAYQSGRHRKVVGLGWIAEAPVTFEEDGKTWVKVKIRMDEPFPRPIDRGTVEVTVPDLEHFRVGRPSFTRVTVVQWSAMQNLFERPFPNVTDANPDAPLSQKNSRDGAPYDTFAQLWCTPVVRAILDECVAIAKKEEYLRWISGGVLLCACERIGRAAPRDSDWNAARWLAQAIDADGFAARRADYFNRHRRRKQGHLPPAPFQFVSSHFAEVIEEAKRLAGNLEVGARHLVAALLSIGEPRRPPSSWRLLYAATADRHRLLRDLLDGLIERGYPDERPIWILERRRLTQNSAVIAGYTADNPSGEDCLNLDGDITAMASLIVARTVEPPLAIGVFGPWGSGKSFFLRRLREKIRNAAASGDNNYWPNIVQIEFNAWHYVDANLWASLTAHILQQLSIRTKPGLGEPIQQEACRAALALLQLADERLQNAATHEQELTTGLIAAENKTAEVVARIRSDESELAAQVARNLVAGIDFTTEIKNVAGAELALTDLSAIDSAFRDAVTSGKDLRQRLESFAQTATRLDLLRTALIRGQGFWRKTLPWFIVAAGLIGFGWWLFGAQIQQHVFAKLLGVLAPLASAAAGIARWISSQHARITAFLEPLEKVRKNIDDKIQEAEAERQQKIALLQANLEVKRAELRQATSEKADAEKAVAEVKQVARDTVTGKTIDTFVAQRVGSGEYQKHLGLVALVRNDFDQLGNMILTHNGLQNGTREEAVVAALKAKGVEIENLGINRIVLYIDDLDRCPSARVVEVLQAIHLLLAFPVFVVVVAVDSRWMKRALAQEYPLLVGRIGVNVNGTAGNESHSLAQPHATPEDYLEKIFQIPYWLPPMSASACGKLMRSLAGTGQDQRAVLESATAPDRKDDDSHVEEPRPDLPPQDAAGKKDVGGELAPDDDDADIETDTADMDGYEEKPPTPSAERLRLGPAESTSMEELALLVGRSPRAAKRFINTYRVIRASLSESQLERMEAQRSQDAILFLLALSTGAPALALAFESKRGVTRNPRASVTDLLASVVEDVLTAPKSSADCEAGTRARTWTQTAGKRWTSLTRQRLDEWVPRVRRFSFVGDGESLGSPDWRASDPDGIDNGKPHVSK